MLRIEKVFFKRVYSHQYALYSKLVYGYVFLEFIFQINKGQAHNLKLWEPISFFKLLPAEFWFTLVPFAHAILLMSSFLAFWGILSKYVRLICFVSFLVYVGYYMNFGKVFHGYHLLAITLGLLCVGPCSVWGKKVIYDWQYNWPILTIKLYAISIYISNGLRKLFFSVDEWIDGTMLYFILYALPGKNSLVAKLLELPLWVFEFASIFVVVIIQLLSPLSLLGKKMSIIYFSLFFMFHLGTIVVLGNHFEFYSYIVCNMVFLIFPKDEK